VLIHLKAAPSMALIACSSDVCDNNECLKALILGLAVVEPVVDLLDNDRKTEKPEAQIEIEIVYADTRLFCIAFDQFHPG